MNEHLHTKIDDTINSLNGINRAEANPFLYSKIMNRMQTVNEFVPKKLAWRMVMALAVVALVNVFTISHFTSSSSKTENSNGAKLVANEYSISLPQSY